MSIVHAEITKVKADIASLTAWIEIEVDNRGNTSPDWGDHGALTYVREKLIEILASLTGSETDEVHQHLSEHNAQD